MEKLDPRTLQKQLDDAGHRIETARSGSEVNAIVERLIADLIDSEFASLWIFDEKRGVLVREREGKEGILNEISIQEQQGIIARSFLTMSGGIYNYLASEKEYVARFDNPDNIRIKSKLIVPLVDGERFLGLATAYSSVRRIRNFTEEDMRLLEALVPFLTEAIYKIRPDLREKQVNRVYLDSSLLAKAESVSEKVETMIQESREQEERPDEILNFLANTVHDIRTPANSLFGFLELLEERIEDNRLLQFVRNAKDSAQFINELTTSILDRISLQHGKGSEPVEINPIKFFSDVASVFSANMYDKRIAYNVFIDPRLPAEIRVDAFRLKRVILNLLGNAWKFTPRGKSIELSVEYDPQTKKMEIAVIDTGIGIAPEKQRKIFDAFAQAEDTTSLEYGGTGLGLSISNRYVSELGGKLQLQSELEKGSKFFFDVPVEVVEEASRFPVLAVAPGRVDILMEKHHASSARPLFKYLQRLGIDKDRIRTVSSLEDLGKDTTHLIAFSSLLGGEEAKRLQSRGVSLLVVEEELFSLTGEASYENVPVVSAYTAYLPELYEMLSRIGDGGPLNPRTRKVLVVDDNRINIELLRAILEEELYQVETAVEGEDGLRQLADALKRGEPFSLAFVDRHLPDLSGTELMERYRALERNRTGVHLHAVSITGDPMESEEERRLFDAIMRKPFNRQEVKKILNGLEEG
jgi:signal transduction histidine kinase/CheY-like chemotaxis protein